ncbi:MAG: DUF2461 domain-containing protein [Pseudomonadota bacterium]
MADKSIFSGFPVAAVKFLNELNANNSREWFAAHRKEYEDHLLSPARDFVYELGKRLTELSPNVNADPRTDKSIFRINRDTRFSADKSPYKTHLGIFFWEGAWPKMECSGFYFHLQPPELMLAAGMHRFPKPVLEEFRNAVADPRYGANLADAISRVTSKPGYQVGGTHYKRVPRGFDSNHERADLLLHNGLYAMFNAELPAELHTPEIVDYCFERFKDMSPLHSRLVEMTARRKK